VPADRGTEIRHSVRLNPVGELNHRWLQDDLVAAIELSAGIRTGCFGNLAVTIADMTH
jgi:hypothetical protein